MTPLEKIKSHIRKKNSKRLFMELRKYGFCSPDSFMISIWDFERLEKEYTGGVAL
jgi:hypothetical protein